MSRRGEEQVDALRDGGRGGFMGGRLLVRAGYAEGPGAGEEGSSLGSDFG